MSERVETSSSPTNALFCSAYRLICLGRRLISLRLMSNWSWSELTSYSLVKCLYCQGEKYPSTHPTLPLHHSRSHAAPSCCLSLHSGSPACLPDCRHLAGTAHAAEADRRTSSLRSTPLSSWHLTAVCIKPLLRGQATSPTLPCNVTIHEMWQGFSFLSTERREFLDRAYLLVS